MNNLQEKSKIYYTEADVYDVFSRAEDFDGAVFSFLKPHVAGKTVLDLGCGTGKYLELLAPHVKHITGLDAAPAQLAVAAEKMAYFTNAELVEGDALDAVLPPRKYDVIIACWMLGTIADAEKRKAIIARFENLLVDGGCFFLIENAPDSEFEAIRGRTNDPAMRTRSYNNWLVEKVGFAIAAELAAHFRFPTLETAQDIFAAIWGDDKRVRITSPRIGHGITVFEKRKKRRSLNV